MGNLSDWTEIAFVMLFVFLPFQDVLPSDSGMNRFDSTFYADSGDYLL